MCRNLSQEGRRMDDMNEKRLRILRSAMEIFADHPYHQVKMEAIAHSAGVGKGTLYEYFDSKDHLFIQLIEVSARIYYSKLVEAVGKGKNSKEKLAILFRHQLAFMEKHADMARILLGERRLPHQECKAIFHKQRTELKQFVTALLEEGVACGEFRPVDIEAATQAVLGTLAGFWVHIFLEEVPLPDPEERTAKTIDFFLYGLASSDR